jgi:hypothetical protein
MSTANTAITEAPAAEVPNRETAFTSSRLLPTVVVFLLALAIFGRRVDRDDFTKHFELTGELAQGKSVQAHPLFHACLVVFTAGSSLTMPGIAAAMLASALAWRTWMTADLLAAGRQIGVFGIVLLCVLLALAMPLPIWWRSYLMVGQPSANIWHNPTAPFATPFCLALFLVGMRLLDQLDYRTAAPTGALMVLSLLAKPNYVLAFVPVYGPTLLGVLWQARQKGRPASNLIGIALLAFGPAVVVAAAQAVLLHERSVVFISFLQIWKIYSPSIPGSLVLGTAYPLAVAICYLPQVNVNRTMTLAWLTFGVGCATFALMGEADRLAANWGWGMHLSVSVLYVMSTAFLFRQPTDWRRWLCLAVLMLHAASGVAYLLGYQEA